MILSNRNKKQKQKNVIPKLKQQKGNSSISENLLGILLRLKTI